jgi:hypothetical protein
MKTDPKEKVCEGVYWIRLSQVGTCGGFCEHGKNKIK